VDAVAIRRLHDEEVLFGELGGGGVFYLLVNDVSFFNNLTRIKSLFK
jgi:hypothetical protein